MTCDKYGGKILQNRKTQGDPSNRVSLRRTHGLLASDTPLLVPGDDMASLFLPQSHLPSGA